MQPLRRRLRALAYVTSLLVMAAAAWMPTSVFAQVMPGSPFGGSGTAATSFANPMPGDLELRDPAQLAAESLTNGVLTSGTSWTASGDFALALNAATYTHSAGSGAFQQTSAAGAIPWASAGINGWFSLTYTTTAVTGAPVCTVPSTFALAAQDLTEAAGTYTIVFQAMATTVGAFSIACTSGAAATITFDTLSLKQINGGDLTVQGRVLVGAASLTVPSIANIKDSDTGISWFPTVDNTLIFIAGGAGQWYMDGSQFYPTANDADTLGISTALVKELFLSRSIQGSKTKALTAGAATTFVTVAVPQTDLVNFASGEVIWTARASDATDIQTLQGRSAFNCVNKAGTETCAAIVTALNTLVAASGGAGKDDLACTITAVTGLTDVIGLAANCASTEMTETSLVLSYRLDMPQANTVAPQ